MNDIGTQLRDYFEATTDPVRIEEILDSDVVIVGPGGNPTEGNEGMDTKEVERQSATPSRWRGPRTAVAAAAVVMVVVAGAVVLSDGGGTAHVVATIPPPNSVAPTTAPPTTVAPTTTPTTAAVPPDPATGAVDRLPEVYNAQDAEGIAAYFGDDVAYNSPIGQELIGADAIAFWEGHFGDTGERITDGSTRLDGRTLFLLVFTTPGGSESTQEFQVKMEGERLVRIDDRGRAVAEIIAEGEVDDVYEAFNDQDIDRLGELVEGMTYTNSPVSS